MKIRGRTLLLWVPAVLAVLLLALSLRYHAAFSPVRTGTNLVLEKVMAVFWYPVEAVGRSVRRVVAFGVDIARGEASDDNQSTPFWQAQYIRLYTENQNLAEQLHYIPSAHYLFKTSRVIGLQQSPFLSRLLIDRGRDAGFAVGNAVLYKGAFVGRLRKVFEHSAEVMLITDRHSSIPVLNAGNLSNSLLNGRGTPYPLIRGFDQFGSAVKVGDKILTSGLEGSLPQGLPIGVISKVRKDGSAILEPYRSFIQMSLVVVIIRGEEIS